MPAAPERRPRVARGGGRPRKTSPRETCALPRPGGSRTLQCAARTGNAPPARDDAPPAAAIGSPPPTSRLRRGHAAPTPGEVSSAGRHAVAPRMGRPPPGSVGPRPRLARAAGTERHLRGKSRLDRGRGTSRRRRGSDRPAGDGERAHGSALRRPDAPRSENSGERRRIGSVRADDRGPAGDDAPAARAGGRRARTIAPWRSAIRFQFAPTLQRCAVGVPGENR